MSQGREKTFGDGWKQRWHKGVNVLQLYTGIWLRWQILCRVCFTTIKNNFKKLYFRILLVKRFYSSGSSPRDHAKSYLLALSQAGNLFPEGKPSSVARPGKPACTPLTYDSQLRSQKIKKRFLLILSTLITLFPCGKKKKKK